MSLHDRVQEALARADVTYTIRDHNELSAEIKTPADFAAALGYPLPRIAKTLFLCGRPGQSYAAVVCSAARRISFSAIAEALGVSRVEVASAQDLLEKTSYPKNGVSPLGLQKDIAVIVDAPLLEYPTVLVGGGATAVEVELAPADLVLVSGAAVASVT